MAPQGEKIAFSSGKLSVPDRPILPFIEGDGTGRDIWRASQAVFDAAVATAASGRLLGWRYWRARRPSKRSTIGFRPRR
jgi:isocitrate dehydrogenase